MSAVFFFQAEDGIRDIGVTGVQTCALPISAQLPAFAQAGWIAPSEVQLLSSLAGRRGWRALVRPRSGPIGRASCWERVLISVVAGSLKKNINPTLFSLLTNAILRSSITLTH